MEEKVILSICIPSHNRVDVILENLKDILKVSDDRFDIIITDSSNHKGELDKLLEIKDKRVKNRPAGYPYLYLPVWRRLCMDYGRIRMFSDPDSDCILKLPEILRRRRGVQRY